MRSVALTVLCSVVLLTPAFSSAQQIEGGMNYGQNTPAPGSFNFTGWQQFSGGVFMTPGSMFGGGMGAGGFGVGGLAITLINIINGVLVPLLFAVSFIVFLYGIAKAYILSPGDEEAVKSGHKILLWGLIGFAVMVSVWGLVNVVVNTFGLATPFGITPTSVRTR